MVQQSWMLRSWSSQALGYTLSAIVMTPLTAWAKHSGRGMTVLVVLCAVLAIICAIWRWKTGFWPGDEPDATGPGPDSGKGPQTPPTRLPAQRLVKVSVPQVRRHR